MNAIPPLLRSDDALHTRQCNKFEPLENFSLKKEGGLNRCAPALHIAPAVSAAAATHLHGGWPGGLQPCVKLQVLWAAGSARSAGRSANRRGTQALRRLTQRARRLQAAPA